MKLVRQKSLAYQEGKSDKVYEVDLCEVGENQYVVNFRYGRRGAALKDGSKTVLPVTLDKAEKIFGQLVGSKVKKGYRDASEAPPPKKAAKSTTSRPPLKDNLEKRKQTVLEQLHQSLEGKAKHGRPLGRLLWRAGEMGLTEAVPAMLAMKKTGDPMTAYCLAWALGRLGSASALPRLKEMQGDSAYPDHVRHMAAQAYLALCDDSQREDFLKPMTAGLPDSLKKELSEGSPQSFGEAFRQYWGDEGPKEPGVLSSLYLIDNATVRPALLEALTSVPYVPVNYRRPGYPVQLRRIFKAAEFRRDAECFGLLARRFEKVAAGFDGYYGYRNTDATRRTVQYYRRRAWRTLWRLGQLEDESYVPMAVGVLLAVSDDDARPPYRHTRWHYDRPRINRRVQTSTIHFDAYCRFYVFNRLLFDNSARYEVKPGSLTWNCREPFHPGDAVPDQREEAFPHLWDRQPRGLLHLLSDSRCLWVHQFAVKALRANKNFCKQLGTEVITMMLARPYEITQELALDLARERFQPQAPDMSLVTALLDCPLPAAHTLAMEWVTQNRGAFISSPGFLQGIALSPREEVRKLAREFLLAASFPAAQSDALLKALLENMAGLSEESQLPIASDLGETVRLAFTSQLRVLDLALILPFLDHPLAPLRAFAGHVLGDHRTPAEHLPPEIFDKLITAEDEAIRGAGIRLFGQLPISMLLKKQELVLSFCLSPLADVRQAVRPVLEKLASHNPEFGRILSGILVHHLLRKEAYDGFYADLCGTLLQALPDTLSSIDIDLLQRLLKSRSTDVQALGAHVLTRYFKAADFSVSQMAGFLHHDILQVRDLGRQWCRENTGRLKAEMSETVRIFDSKWDDAREFAFTFFTETFGQEDLTPDILTGICDSVRPDVQDFGCGLVTRFFQEEHGPDYMLKLSQHPSPKLQLFVTNYLSRYAAGSPERVEELSGYFVRVLSLVNKGRVAKQRIYAFLKEEALGSPKMAELAAAILGHVSATIAVADKAACIQVLRDIRRQFPDIPVPLAVQPVEVRPARADARPHGGSHAV